MPSIIVGTHPYLCPIRPRVLRLRCLYLLDSFAKNNDGKVKNKETFQTIIGLLIELIEKKDKEQTIILKASLSQNRGQTTRLKLLNNWTCKSTKK